MCASGSRIPPAPKNFRLMPDGRMRPVHDEDFRVELARESADREVLMELAGCDDLKVKKAVLLNPNSDGDVRDRVYGSEPDQRKRNELHMLYIRSCLERGKYGPFGEYHCD